MDRPYEQVPTPPLSQASSLPADVSPPLRHMLTPPIEATGTDGPITPASSSSDLVLSTGELSPSTWAPQSPGLLARGLAYLDEDVNPEDPENLQVELLSGLVLDRQVPSNMVSFVHIVDESFSIRTYPTHQRMILIANSVLNVSESTNYDLTPFTILYNQLIKGVVEARAQGNLSRQVAVEAMQSCHEVISIMCKVCSLASILNTMNLCAPVFRRACPESSTELVNLPNILTGFDVHLKLYATMDVLLSAITSRPMYFRYDLAFPSPTTESILNADDGPGLRWLIGVPDRLIVTLARMNTFLEEHGPRLGLVHVQALEKEIMACSTAFSSGYGTDPALALGRIVVQESWRLVASIYLYMARIVWRRLVGLARGESAKEVYALVGGYQTASKSGYISRCAAHDRKSTPFPLSLID
ncbi:hypothetical protein RSOLAG22IIIB_10888 [Rhizoctonia solani]|uniref:Uncharacterized protein n=1 Tax=Rhizoctonia solani TaxID=456999 RepID=A0A0K6G573_9AGAM|nr:hypothetical protein RSOLAG22IIIB_10888 [Rhizoctonia solani]